MILDYRLYCSIYALCFLALVVSPALIHAEGPWFERLFGGSLLAGAVTALVNYLDWLWA